MLPASVRTHARTHIHRHVHPLLPMPLLISHRLPMSPSLWFLHISGSLLACTPAPTQVPKAPHGTSPHARHAGAPPGFPDAHTTHSHPPVAAAPEPAAAAPALANPHASHDVDDALLMRVQRSQDQLGSWEAGALAPMATEPGASPGRSSSSPEPPSSLVRSMTTVQPDASHRPAARADAGARPPAGAAAPARAGGEARRAGTGRGGAEGA